MAFVTIKIPRRARVFLLEDSEERIKWFRERVQNLTIANTAEQAITILSLSPPFDYIFLDHDLGVLDTQGHCAQGDGMQVAKHIAGSGFLGRNVVVHSWNAGAAQRMACVLEGCVVIPFGQFEIQVM